MKDFKSLRKRINEVMVDKSIVDDATDLILAAMQHELLEMLDDAFASNVYEKVAAHVPNDSFMRPARYEDVEFFAEKIATLVLKEPEIKDRLESVIASVIRSTMR